MKILLLAEHDNRQLTGHLSQCVTAAKQLNAHIDVLVAGYHCETVAKQASGFNVDCIRWADHLHYQHHLAENLGPLIQTLASAYTHIMAPASCFGKDLIPRVAALLEVAALSDVINVIDQNTFERPVYAGHLIETVQSLDEKKVMTIRTTAFKKSPFVDNQATIAPIQRVIAPKGIISCEIEQTVFDDKLPQLTEARIVVSGGRGLQSQSQFDLLAQLADKLGAAIGGTCAAVAAGFISEDNQIGQTGRIIAPDLYIAVGISGAIQHLAGIKDSKVIVAINQDRHAPIFEIADYGLIGDLSDVLPELINCIDTIQEII